MFKPTNLALLCAVLATTSSAFPLSSLPEAFPDCPSTFTTATAGIPPHEIAALFSNSTFPPASSDIEQIRATIALYGLALDGKNFAILDQVFTPDVRANYSALGVMNGVEELKSTLAASLEPVASTQHQFGTIVAQLCRDVPTGQTAAVSVAYTTTSHFPVGPDGEMLSTIPAAEVITGYVMYQDVWVEHGAVYGHANGNTCGNAGCDAAGLSRGDGWRIRSRNTVTMGPLAGGTMPAGN